MTTLDEKNALSSGAPARPWYIAHVISPILAGIVGYKLLKFNRKK